MPIRSPRGRTAAYRVLWQWPLRSPARLALTVGVFVAVVLAVSTAVGAVSGSPSGALAVTGPTASRSATAAPVRDGAPSAARTPTPTALPPVPELTPDALPLSSAPPAALEVAARWSAAWLRPPDGTSAQQWIEGLRPSTTEEYLGVLQAVDPANIPATQVTGEPRAVRVATSSVEVEVPTDALTLVVLVVDTEDGWRVSGYDRV